MRRNMGSIDRGLRIIVAALLVIVAYTVPMASAGPLHWLALAIAVVFILTSIMGNCPLYSIIGLKTCRNC